MTIWGLVFSLLTAWSLFVTLAGMPLPVIIKDGEEIKIIKLPDEDEVFSVEEIISLKQGEGRVVLHAMGEECFWRFAPLCIFAVAAPGDVRAWWALTLVIALVFALLHIQYSLLLRVLVYLPLGVVWGTIYLYLLEWFGAPGLIGAFVGVSVWHSIPNTSFFRDRIAKLAQLQNAVTG